MTALFPNPQATGPIRTTPSHTPARSRRLLELAALKRRARRRATWIRHDIETARTVELPFIALITGGFGVAAITLAALGVFELIASAVLS